MVIASDDYFAIGLQFQSLQQVSVTCAQIKGVNAVTGEAGIESAVGVETHNSEVPSSH